MIDDPFAVPPLLVLGPNLQVPSPGSLCPQSLTIELSLVPDQNTDRVEVEKDIALTLESLLRTGLNLRNFRLVKTKIKFSRSLLR